jgi:hypothetical protein
MDLLHEPPPTFHGIANVFAMAKHLPGSQQLEVKIGFLHDGVLFATARLDGARQLTFAVEHLREMGWHEHLLGTEAARLGCNVLFAHRARAAAPDEDPSFIRRTAVQLWPAGGPHAEA